MLRSRDLRTFWHSVGLFTGATAGAILFGIGSTYAAPQGVTAPPVSGAQIEAFKKLPRSEQERLAKQYGVNLDQLGTGATPSPQKNIDTLDQPTPVAEAPSDTRMKAPEAIPTPGVPEIEQLAQGELRKLKPFGYDLFLNAPSTFAPATDIPVPNDFIVGPGDLINLQLYGNENASYNLTVSREGTIQIPKLGPIQVAGLPYSTLTGTLKSRIAKQMIGVNVSVSMGPLRSIRVFVLGDSQKPGSYVVSSLSTATNALFASGGIQLIGSLRNIQIKRLGQTLGTLDLYDLLLKGDTSQDRRLQAGDVIFVPPVSSRVAIDGRVRRPGIYEIKPGETVKDLVRMAGGLTAEAYAYSAALERIDNKKLRTIKNVDLENPETNETKLQDGDAIVVHAVADLVEDSIELAGAVTRPGVYQWQEGIRVSDFIKNKNTDLEADVGFDYGLIVREKNDRRDITVLQFNVADMLANPKSDKDPELKKRDKVLFFTNLVDRDLGLESYRDISQTQLQAPTALQAQNRGRTDESISTTSYGGLYRNKLLPSIIKQLESQSRSGEPPEVVEVAGSVRFPGKYPKPENYNALQLISAAGGLTEDAYTLNAEISRVTVNATTEAKIEHFPVDLRAVFEAPDTAPTIQTRDRLFVRQIPDWAEQKTVELIGEFQFPGKYVIRRGETLSDVVKRAGGVTSRADVRASVFTREDLKKQELERLQTARAQLEIEIAATTVGTASAAGSAKAPSVDAEKAQRASQMLAQLEKTKAMGRLVVDLPAALDEDSSQDIRMEDGDKLYLPSVRQTVSVIGEVLYPSSHVYESGVTFDEFVDRSGGTSAQADTGRIYIIRANGQVARPARGLSAVFSSGIKPGDTIVVPLDSDHMKPLPFWTAVTQIIYQSAVAVAAIGSLL